MKKAILIGSFLLLLSLVGCDTPADNDIEFQLRGMFYYEEAIYLNPLSSATLEYESDRVKGTHSIEITDDILVHQYDDESETYEHISFKEENVKKDFDELLSLDPNKIFDDFDKRYDLYNNNTGIGLSLFMIDNQVYIAETRYLGSNDDVFTVWTVYKLSTDSFVNRCQKTEVEIAYSGIRTKNQAYECIVNGYEYTYSSGLEGFELFEEKVSITVYEESEAHFFIKCEYSEETPDCDGTWQKLSDTFMYEGEEITRSVVVVPRSFFMYESINLDWFEEIAPISNDDWLYNNYNLISKEENKADICKYLYGEQVAYCVGYNDQEAPDMYLKLDEEGNILKVFHLTFPSRTITFIPFDDIIPLPIEVIDMLNE